MCPLQPERLNLGHEGLSGGIIGAIGTSGGSH